MLPPCLTCTDQSVAPVYPAQHLAANSRRQKSLLQSQRPRAGKSRKRAGRSEQGVVLLKWDPANKNREPRVPCQASLICRRNGGKSSIQQRSGSRPSRYERALFCAREHIRTNKHNTHGRHQTLKSSSALNSFETPSARRNLEVKRSALYSLEPSTLLWRIPVNQLSSRPVKSAHSLFSRCSPGYAVILRVVFDPTAHHQLKRSGLQSDLDLNKETF